jgi:hypothetical protein
LWLPVFVLIFAGLALLWPRDAPTFVVPTAELDQARESLAGLEIRDAAPSQDYAREKFGAGWADLDGDGCRTRDDVLRRDLHGIERDGCHVTAGELDDPYGGGTVPLDEIEIDHVVALADAWRTGAQKWSPIERLTFANDPLNLLAVDRELNQDKGAADAAEWLPPTRSYRCPYAIRQITVKARYGLWVTSAERAVLEHELDRCRTTGS